MFWNRNTSSCTGEFSPKANGAEFNNTNNGYWNHKRGGARRANNFPYSRREMHMRGDEFFAPRGFPSQEFVSTFNLYFSYLLLNYYGSFY